MGQGTNHALWLRSALMAERERRDWSLEQTARAIGKETGQGLSKQSLDAWEKFRVQPKIDQFAAWARVLGFRLEVDLVRPEQDTAVVRVPASLAPLVWELAALPEEDRERVSDLVRRFKAPA